MKTSLPFALKNRGPGSLSELGGGDCEETEDGLAGEGEWGDPSGRAERGLVSGPSPGLTAWAQAQSGPSGLSSGACVPEDERILQMVGP